MSTPALAELQRLVRHMVEELASFRRRAFQAEARIRELEQSLGEAQQRVGEKAPRRARGGDDQATLPLEVGPPPDAERLAGLERENASLRLRLDAASDRTRQLLDRVRFLRQQQEQEAAR